MGVYAFCFGGVFDCFMRSKNPGYWRNKNNSAGCGARWWHCSFGKREKLFDRRGQQWCKTGRRSTDRTVFVVGGHRMPWLCICDSRRWGSYQWNKRTSGRAEAGSSYWHACASSRRISWWKVGRSGAHSGRKRNACRFCENRSKYIWKRRKADRKKRFKRSDAVEMYRPAYGHTAGADKTKGGKWGVSCAWVFLWEFRYAFYRGCGRCGRGTSC